MCEGGIEKSVPGDHRLSSLGKPRDAKSGSLGQIFYFTLTLMIDSYDISHTTWHQHILLFDA